MPHQLHAAVLQLPAGQHSLQAVQPPIRHAAAMARDGKTSSTAHLKVGIKPVQERDPVVHIALRWGECERMLLET